MRPWRVAVGLTMTVGALAVWALWAELWYLQPFWQVLVADYGWYIAAHGGLAVMTFAAGVYVAAGRCRWARSAARWMWSSGRFVVGRDRIRSWRRRWRGTRRATTANEGCASWPDLRSSGHRCTLLYPCVELGHRRPATRPFPPPPAGRRYPSFANAETRHRRI